ncbi:MAG: alpha/beta hydrolase [Betaproteobacteria bacterium]|nr:alpha/beta hydrolase [Betaproteobacteria bacterium]
MEINLWRTDFHTSNGFKQFYRDWQPRDERYLPVLALHGSLTQSGMWNALAEAVGSIRMLCPDQRGFGRSNDPGGDSCGEFASDALALAQNLLPERYVVMGHSFACSITLEVARMAAEHVAAVVLVDPVVPVGTPPAAPTAPSIPLPETFARLEAAERHFRDTEEGTWTDDALRRFVQDIMMRDSESGPWRFPYAPMRLRRLRAFTASPASDFNLFAKATAVRCPALVFRGGMSKRFPLAAEQPFLEAFASKPRVVLCPNSGHVPTATEPNIVVEALKRFLVGVR